MARKIPRQQGSYRGERRNDARLAYTHAKTERRKTVREGPVRPPLVRWPAIWEVYQRTWPWEKLSRMKPAQ